MTMTAEMPGQVPWWKEPTKDQWVAWIAAWLGWTLDAFDFTIFLLIMVPIAETFHVPLIEVTAVFTITLWLRLVGAVGSGWLADRIGRKAPLMISILWYSVAISLPASHRILRCSSCSVRCSASAWARSGPPVRRSPWNPGPPARAVS